MLGTLSCHFTDSKDIDSTDSKDIDSTNSKNIDFYLRFTEMSIY